MQSLPALTNGGASCPARILERDAEVIRLLNEARAAREAFLSAESKTDKRRASEQLDRAIRDLGDWALRRGDGWESSEPS